MFRLITVTLVLAATAIEAAAFQVRPDTSLVTDIAFDTIGISARAFATSASPGTTELYSYYRPQFAIGRDSAFSATDSLRWYVNDNPISSIDSSLIAVSTGTDDPMWWGLTVSRLTLYPRVVAILGEGLHTVRLTGHVDDSTVDFRWRVRLLRSDYLQARAVLRVDSVSGFGPTRISLVRSEPLDTAIFEGYRIPPSDALRATQWPVSNWSAYVTWTAEPVTGDTIEHFIAQLCVSDTLCWWQISPFPERYFLDSADAPFSYEQAMRTRGSDLNKLGKVFQSWYDDPQTWLTAYTDTAYWYFVYLSAKETVWPAVSVASATQPELIDRAGFACF